VSTADGGTTQACLLHTQQRKGTVVAQVWVVMQVPGLGLRLRLLELELELELELVLAIVMTTQAVVMLVVLLATLAVAVAAPCPPRPRVAHRAVWNGETPALSS